MTNSCKCQTPPFHYTDYESAYFDSGNCNADISIETCKHCGNIRLKYLIEEPHISRSGRWWRVLVPANKVAEINASNAKTFIDNQTEGFAGGSYFESTGFKYSMNQAYFDKLISDKTHYASDAKTIKCILQSNIKNSVWVRTTLDQSLIGDGWVKNYFQYSKLETESFNRSIVQALDQNQAYFGKEIAISDVLAQT